MRLHSVLPRRRHALPGGWQAAKWVWALRWKQGGSGGYRVAVLLRLHRHRFVAYMQISYENLCSSSWYISCAVLIAWTRHAVVTIIGNLYISRYMTAYFTFPSFPYFTSSMDGSHHNGYVSDKYQLLHLFRWHYVPTLLAPPVHFNRWTRSLSQSGWHTSRSFEYSITTALMKAGSCTAAIVDKRRLPHFTVVAVVAMNSSKHYDCLISSIHAYLAQ